MLGFQALCMCLCLCSCLCLCICVPLPLLNSFYQKLSQMCSIHIAIFNGDKLSHLSFFYILVANSNVKISPNRKIPPKYAHDWPFSLATNCPNSLFHWRQNVPTIFHNFHVHKCISWDILSPGRKWDILSRWDNLSPEKCQ